MDGYTFAWTQIIQINARLVTLLANSPRNAALAMEHDLAKCLGMQDEDGYPDLGAITFKPSLKEEYLLKLRARVYNEEQFNNIVKAILET